MIWAGQRGGKEDAVKGSAGPGAWPPQQPGQASPSGPFLHCGRAVIRLRAWDPEVRIDRSEYPTYGQVLADQMVGADAREIDDSEDEANRERLY